MIAGHSARMGEDTEKTYQGRNSKALQVHTRLQRMVYSFVSFAVFCSKFFLNKRERRQEIEQESFER